MSKFLCGHKFSILFAIYVGLELLSHVVVTLCLTFLGTAKLFSKVAMPFCIPTSDMWGFQFLHILAKACYLHLFDYNHPGGCKVISHYGFDLHLMTGDLEHLFTCLLAICSIFFGEMCIQIP